MILPISIQDGQQEHPSKEPSGNAARKSFYHTEIIFFISRPWFKKKKTNPKHKGQEERAWSAGIWQNRPLKRSRGGCWEDVSWFFSCLQLWSLLSHARYWTNENHEKFTFVTKFISALWIQIPNIDKQIPVEKYQSLTMKTFIII